MPVAIRRRLISGYGAVVIALSVFVAACGSDGPVGDFAAESASRPATIKLEPPDDGRIYFSAYPDFGGDEDAVTTGAIDDFEELIGRPIVWASFSQHWFRELEYPKENIHRIADRGVIPLIRLHPRSSLREFEIEDRFSLQRIIDGEFDAELSAWAQAANEDAVPLLVDFGVEMNGDWFGWSGALNGAGTTDGYGDPEVPDGPERYRDAYRHMIDLFRSEGVSHVTWFFHPTILSEPQEEWNRPKNYYPGDDYIDWIGISVYGAFHPGVGYWDTFAEILDEHSQEITEVSSSKPLAILEFGVTDHHPLGSKPEWLRDAFETIRSGDPLEFRAVNYWHENWDNDGSLTSLRVDSSPETLEEFRSLVADDRFVAEPVFSG